MTLSRQTGGDVNQFFGFHLDDAGMTSAALAYKSSAEQDGPVLAGIQASQIMPFFSHGTQISTLLHQLTSGEQQDGQTLAGI